MVVTQSWRLAGLICMALTAVLAGCRDRDAVSAASVSSARSSASARRDEALRRAKVWAPARVQPSDADFGVNTPGPDAFDADADVDCTFVAEHVNGSTPKFKCALPDGTHVKVKYGGPNGELPAEVAATRLLAALGFPVDRMNRVHSVRCRGCPPLPYVALQCLDTKVPSSVCLQGARDGTVVSFSPAVIERPMAGQKIEGADDQGWSWYELKAIDEKAGGSSRAEVDALRLVAILLAHWDNKGANQKLICPPGGGSDEACRTPIAAIGDLGGAFGPRKVDLVNWTRVPIWADARDCRVSMKSLPYGGSTFPDTQISEAGRQFALRLLGPLTRQQLDTLFVSSGVTSYPHVLTTAHQPQPWTDAFLDKVDQIARAGPCPH